MDFGRRRSALSLVGVRGDRDIVESAALVLAFGEETGRGLKAQTTTSARHNRLQPEAMTRREGRIEDDGDNGGVEVMTYNAVKQNGRCW